jgi:hypothetical protein
MEGPFLVLEVVDVATDDDAVVILGGCNPPTKLDGINDVSRCKSLPLSFRGTDIDDGDTDTDGAGSCCGRICFCDMINKLFRSNDCCYCSGSKSSFCFVGGIVNNVKNLLISTLTKNSNKYHSFCSGGLVWICVCMTLDQSRPSTFGV